MIISPCPNNEFVPIVFTNPPTTSVGSRSAALSMLPSIELVDVFPCVPLTAIDVSLTAISSPSISARRITGIPISFASSISGLFSLTALE